MSRQSEAREAQGYEVKPHICGNCGHFASDVIEKQGTFGNYSDEKNPRCGIGGFAVKKSATCNLWERKVE